MITAIGLGIALAGALAAVAGAARPQVKPVPARVRRPRR